MHVNALPTRGSKEIELEETEAAKKTRYNLKEAWEDLKISIGVGAAIGGGYVIADVWLDE